MLQVLAVSLKMSSYCQHNQVSQITVYHKALTDRHLDLDGTAIDYEPTGEILRRNIAASHAKARMEDIVDDSEGRQSKADLSRLDSHGSFACLTLARNTSSVIRLVCSLSEGSVDHILTRALSCHE